MPHGRGDPMSKTDQADDRHLGTSKRRALCGRDQGLCQLGGAKIVGPAEEERQRDGENETDDIDLMRCCGRLTWAGGASLCSIEACIEEEQAEDGGDLEVVQSALVSEKV